MPPPRRCWIFFACSLALAVALAAARPPRRTPPLSEWSMRDLAARLEERGLALRLVGEHGRSPDDYGYFLADGVSAPAVALLPDRSRIGAWRGRACCWRTRDASRDALLLQEPRHSCKIGPFLFFGDPALLEKIHLALTGRAGRPAER